MKITDFESKTPQFVLERFFDGRLEGWGITLSRFETFQNQFKIDAAGSWHAASGTLSLTETYSFDDGHTDTLQWTILKKSDGLYEGHDARIDGTAGGEQAGNAFHWTYSRDVPAADGSSAKVGFNDWFWLQDDRTMIAHASLTKLGIEVSTLNAFYRRVVV